MKLIINLITAFLIANTAFSQTNGIVTYEIRMPKYEISTNTKANDFNKQICEESLKYNYFLEFNKNKSHFYFQKKMSIENTNNDLEKIIAIMTANGDYYYDKESEELLKVSNDKTLIKEEFVPEEWNVSNESKIIGSYLCYKAICNQKYNQYGIVKTKKITAWFAPSLPYSFGPKQYNGLPGLILELEDSRITLIAVKIDLDESNKIDIIFPKGKIISESDYLKRLPEIPQR